MRSLKPGGLFHEVVHLDEVDSTNRFALDTGMPGLVVLARRQTAGRGRRGSGWYSPEGTNLYMTVTLAPPRDSLPVVAGVAARASIAGLIPTCAVALKWPNDVVVSGKKVCGILCETRADLAAIGIGVNVNQSVWPERLVGRAVSLRQIAGTEFDLDRVAEAVTGELSKWLGIHRDQGFGPLRLEFLRHGLLEEYRVFDDRHRPCTVVDMTMDGHLVVESEGIRRSLASGSISIGW